MINVQFAPAPGMTETALFADFPMDAAKEAKQIIIDCYAVSKTRLSISLRHGNATAGANFIPPGSEGLKFDEVVRNNMFSGTRSVVKYFKVSKKQNRDVFVNHVKNLVQEVFAPQDDFTAIIWENKAMRDLLPVS